MPLLSFVLVAHREQAYLPACAASILEQDFADLELIALDDASPDHVPELLDELAERDPRVRVEHLASRTGPGEGRNLGLELATGDYVWFVNTTDLLPPGALTVVADELRADRPDVTLLGHTYTGPLGNSQAGPSRGALSRAAEHGPGRLEDRRGLAGLAPGVWRKVLRRSLLDELGARFGPGRHGELTVVWPSLLAAERIAAVAETSYDRRIVANAVQDEVAEGSPFDVFPAYDSIFELAERREGMPEERVQVLLGAMVRHLLSQIGSVPDSDRRAFFRESSLLLRRHRHAAGSESGRKIGRRERLLERDAWTAFRALTGLTERRAKGVSIPRPRRGQEPHGALGRYYRARQRQPIDPDLAAFGAYWYRGYACNPAAIYERARELVPEMRAVWVVHPQHADQMPAGVDYVLPRTREYYDLIARARYFVNNVNWPNHVVKREGQVHVMTHHGTPLKRMGLDLRDAAERIQGPRKLGQMLRRVERWDYSVTQNAYTTLIWERVFPGPHETLEVGYPRDDVLARADEQSVGAARQRLGIEAGKRAVLYAPTHREYLEDWQPTLDLDALADGLGPDFVVMARLHYLHGAGANAQLSRLHEEGRIRDVSDHRSVEELALAADALLTDYSSIMFDYAVLDRPIVVHAPDWETYREKRGTYFELLEEPPGVVALTDDEVVHALRSGEAWGQEARQARAAFRAQFAYLDDGRAAERVVRRVWFGEREPVPLQPVLKVAN